MENAQNENLKKTSVWQVLWTKKMFVTLMMGFSSGLPLLLTLRTLQAWMTDVGVDLKTVGIFSLASLPYSLKFLWAPFIDKYPLTHFGRRKSWLLLTQILIMMALVTIATVDPKQNTLFFAILTVLISFFSASQDIATDAYRRELLHDDDLAMGATIFVNGYKIGMWVAGGLALALAEFAGWTITYYAMAVFMLLGVSTTLWADEPNIEITLSRTIREAVIDPFLDFLKRNGAWTILLFLLLYKLGDTMAGSMLTPFYLKMGYSKLEIAAVAKTLSLPITIIGGFIGGALAYKWGIIRCLWLFGIGQMISTVSPILILYTGHGLIPLGIVILLEDLTQSMATSAFVAFMMSQTNKKFTGTQYALLSSLMGIPRSILSSPTGYLAEYFGWFGFFIFCTFIAVPGLILIKLISRKYES